MGKSWILEVMCNFEYPFFRGCIFSSVALPDFLVVFRACAFSEFTALLLAIFLALEKHVWMLNSFLGK
jgi:hypothetical protein